MQIYGRRIPVLACLCGGIAMVFLMYASDKLTEYANWSPTMRFVARSVVGLPPILIAGLWQGRRKIIDPQKTAN